MTAVVSLVRGPMLKSKQTRWRVWQNRFLGARLWFSTKVSAIVEWRGNAMDITYQITFMGVSEIGIAAVDKKLREDIGAYPQSISMGEVTVVRNDGETQPTPEAKPKANAKAQAKPKGGK